MPLTPNSEALKRDALRETWRRGEAALKELSEMDMREKIRDNFGNYEPLLWKFYASDLAVEYARRVIKTSRLSSAKYLLREFIAEFLHWAERQSAAGNSDAPLAGPPEKE